MTITDSDLLWAPAPVNLNLAENAVHVWSACLDLPFPCLQSLHDTLSPDEIHRAERFRFPQDRGRFVAARGILRTILGRYLGVSPARLCFRYDDYGKPSLDGALDLGTLRFNVTHSQGLALYALTRNHDIGIDLECLRQIPEADRLATRFFSDQENAALGTLPAHLRQEAFFACWTRKEAYLKAKGKGLSVPLHQFDVSVMPGEPPMVLDVRGDPGEASHWSLHDLRPAPGYIAALAVHGHGWELECWQFPLGSFGG